MQKAVATTIGMHPEAAKRASQVVLATDMCTFSRALMGEPAADVDLLNIALRRNGSLERVNREAAYASVAMDIAKGRVLRVVAD